MSAELISRSPDLRRLISENFDIEIRAERQLLVHSVPYVSPSGRLARGTIVSPLDHTQHTVHFIGEVPCDRLGRPLPGLVNQSGTFELGDEIIAQHYLSNKREGLLAFDNLHQKIWHYVELISRPAKGIDPSASALVGTGTAVNSGESVFQYPDTASIRYGIGGITDKLKGHRVGIVGLGGSGAYVLDLVAKTPVSEIHLFDKDQFFRHNAFRSPGAASIEQLHHFPQKVSYYAELFGQMHAHIRAHPYHVDEANITELLALDFVFICVDKGPPREMLAKRLYEGGVPFIDVGMGVGQENGELDAQVRVTAALGDRPDWSTVRQYLPCPEEDEEDEYDTHIQIAELNALNASLAVIRWKRSLGFYRNARDEVRSLFLVERNAIFNRES